MRVERYIAETILVPFLSVLDVIVAFIAVSNQGAVLQPFLIEKVNNNASVSVSGVPRSEA